MIMFNTLLSIEQPWGGGPKPKFTQLQNYHRKRYQDQHKGKAKVQLVNQMLP